MKGTKVDFIDVDTLTAMSLEDTFRLGAIFPGIAQSEGMRWELAEKAKEGTSTVYSFCVTYFGVYVGTHELVTENKDVIYREVGNGK